MKTRFFAVVLFFIASFGAHNAFAQRASSFNNEVAFDIVNYLINNMASIQYETKLNATTGLAIRGEYVHVTEAGGDPTVAYGFGGAYRFYTLDSRALSGFSVGPAIDLMFFKNSGTDRHGLVFALGGDAEYKWFFGAFTFEPTFGLRWGYAPGSLLPAGESNFSGVYYNVNIYLGYAW